MVSQQFRAFTPGAAKHAMMKLDGEELCNDCLETTGQERSVPHVRSCRILYTAQDPLLGGEDHDPGTQTI